MVMTKLKFVAWVLVSTVMISCGGGLTDEQRKKIKEEMETSQIKKISEAEITEATMTNGRRLSAVLKDSSIADSLAKAENVKIKWLQAGQADVTEMERQLIDAYLTQLSGGSMDNVQKIGKDTLLYTVPIVVKRDDGVDEVKGIWSIYFTRKQIVLGL
jgi:ABC-type phosphate/phosphonate transport system substrate-binding protein